MKSNLPWWGFELMSLNFLKDLPQSSKKYGPTESTQPFKRSNKISQVF